MPLTGLLTFIEPYSLFLDYIVIYNILCIQQSLTLGLFDDNNDYMDDCFFTSLPTVFSHITMDGCWMDDLTLFHPFRQHFKISRQWVGVNKRLCAVEPHL